MSSTSSSSSCSSYGSRKSSRRRSPSPNKRYDSSLRRKDLSYSRNRSRSHTSSKQRNRSRSPEHNSKYRSNRDDSRYDRRKHNDSISSSSRTSKVKLDEQAENRLRESSGLAIATTSDNSRNIVPTGAAVSSVIPLIAAGASQASVLSNLNFFSLADSSGLSVLIPFTTPDLTNQMNKINAQILANSRGRPFIRGYNSRGRNSQPYYIPQNRNTGNRRPSMRSRVPYRSTLRYSAPRPRPPRQQQTEIEEEGEEEEDQVLDLDDLELEDDDQLREEEDENFHLSDVDYSDNEEFDESIIEHTPHYRGRQQRTRYVPRFIRNNRSRGFSSRGAPRYPRSSQNRNLRPPSQNRRFLSRNYSQQREHVVRENNHYIRGRGAYTSRRRGRN